MNREYIQIEFWKGDKFYFRKVENAFGIFPCMNDMEYFDFPTLAEATKKANQIAFENGAGNVSALLTPDENGNVDFVMSFKNGRSMRVVTMIEFGE
jgi:hypothetical protein